MRECLLYALMKTLMYEDHFRVTGDDVISWVFQILQLRTLEPLMKTYLRCESEGAPCMSK